MHQALRIEEILLSIFGHCHNRYRTVVPEMAAIARTCSAFKEPALDVLWANLDNLSPLARCLPETSHNVSSDPGEPFGTYSFSKPLTQIEWDIVRCYTTRVRRVIDFSAGLNQKSLGILSNPPTPAPLFPNIRSVSCTYTAHSMHLLYPPMPSLEFLSIHFDNPHASQDFIKSLPDYFPTIRRLCIGLDQGEVTFNKLVSDCIRLWRNLRSLLAFQIALSTDALVHLSRTPALCRLDFVVDNTFLPFDQPLCFSTLLDLVLRSDNWGPVSQLLSGIRLPIVIDFSVFVESCPSRRELSFFLEVLRTSGIGDTMKTFTLFQSPYELDIVRSEVLLGFEDLKPCMAFGNLVRLEYEIGYNVNLTDSDLHTLTLAWPHLKWLLINVKWGWNTSGGITPNGLLRLLQTCRSLVEIALVIDARGYTRIPGHESLTRHGVTLPPTFAIHLLDSVIEGECVQALAIFFASIGVASCPNFTFSVWEGARIAQPRLWRIYRKRWNAVFRRATDLSLLGVSLELLRRPDWSVDTESPDMPVHSN